MMLSQRRPFGDQMILLMCYVLLFSSKMVNKGKIVKNDFYKGQVTATFIMTYFVARFAVFCSCCKGSEKKVGSAIS